jgi:hypothetical protein
LKHKCFKAFDGGDKRDRTAAKPAASRLASQLLPLRSKNAPRFEVSGLQTFPYQRKNTGQTVRCFPLVEISGIEPLRSLPLRVLLRNFFRFAQKKRSAF